MPQPVPPRDEAARGQTRAEYGQETVARLAADVSARYGWGFSVRNIRLMHAFHRSWPIGQTPSAELGDRVHRDENPPVGLILCARRDEAVARYALEGPLDARDGDSPPGEGGLST